MSSGTILTSVDDVEARPSVVSIGFFDGVHRGHQTIIQRALRAARERDLRSAVVTFDRHPMEVVAPGSQPPLLMTLERRARTLSEQGVDLVIVVPFDDDLRHRSPEDFLDRTLSPLQPRHVVVGANFRFGHKATGDVAVLTDLGAQRGFGVEGVSLLEVDGEAISSTSIRAAIDAGDVEGAARMLGRPHVLDGIVVRGDQRGAGLGFPTANLRVAERMAVPGIGVYAGKVALRDGSQHPAATNVGVSPTFGGTQLRVEAHLLDFSGDLYGMTAAVDFRHRLRGEERFDSVEDLIHQMHDDVLRARRLLG